MSKPFLGVGWSFPLAVVRQDDADSARAGQLRIAEYEESVRQSIWLILGTARGERVMRPDFGCGIHDLVFAPNTPATAARLMAAVREALLDFEPRIDVRDVTVSPSGGGGEVLLLGIDYEVRAT